jgi:hypothetical protein
MRVVALLGGKNVLRIMYANDEQETLKAVRSGFFFKKRYSSNIFSSPLDYLNPQSIPFLTRILVRNSFFALPFWHFQIIGSVCCPILQTSRGF